MSASALCGMQKLSTAVMIFRVTHTDMGAQWLSGRVLDSRPKGRGFEPHWRHCVVVLEQDTLILQPRKTRPFITEKLLMGRKELNQTNPRIWGWD